MLGFQIEIQSSVNQGAQHQHIAEAPAAAAEQVAHGVAAAAASCCCAVVLSSYATVYIKWDHLIRMAIRRQVIM